MKKEMTRRARPVAPRNPLVAAARFRSAGAHGGGIKRERQAARRSLASALRELKQGP